MFSKFSRHTHRRRSPSLLLLLLLARAMLSRLPLLSRHSHCMPALPVSLPVTAASSRRAPHPQAFVVFCVSLEQAPQPESVNNQ
jgi:hypothetical protein